MSHDITAKRLAQEIPPVITAKRLAQEVLPDITIKIIVIGNTHVGKSSIIQSYMDSHVKLEYASTIGVDFFTKDVTVNEKKVRVVIWDTTGQERYRSIIQSYYRGAHAVLIVFDLTDMYSFNNVLYWIDQTNRTMDPGKYVMILIGNKRDGVVSVKPDQITKLLQEYTNLKYIETSARTGHNIHSVFETCITNCYHAGYYQDRLTANLIIKPETKNTETCC